MRLQPPNDKYAKKRANTLDKATKFAAATQRSQRSDIEKEWNKIPLSRYRMDDIKSRPGYDFLPYNNSIYDYETLQHVSLLYRGMLTAGKMKLPDKKIFIRPTTIMEIERTLADIMTKPCKEKDFKISYDSVDQFDSSNVHADFSQLEGQPAVILRYTFNDNEPGCMIMKNVIRGGNAKLIYAMAILEKLLGVYTWENMGLSDAVDQMIDYLGCGYYYDDEEEEQGKPFDCSNWRGIDKEFTLPASGNTIHLGKLALAEAEWKAGYTDMMSIFNASLLNTSLDQVEQWLVGKDHVTIFLRGVLYLVEQGFQLDNYTYNEDMNERYYVPVEESYGMLWDTDEYFYMIDESANSRYEGGLGLPTYTEFYFPEGILKPAGKNHFQQLAAFGHLFYFNTETNTFYEKNKRVSPHLAALRLHEWRPLLHRAIERYRRTVDKRLETNQRRVYP